MKKILFILTLAAVSLTSCLKDKPNTDFSGIGTVIELPYSGLQYFAGDAITDPGPAIVRQFGINIASAKTLSTATNYSVAVDDNMLAAYDAANSAVVFLPMPAGSYTISKLTGTIAAGKRLDSVTVTFDKSKLDPSKSYMLVIKLASATNGILSGNFNAHYYHFIGNDFAGAYVYDYRRWQNGTGAGAPDITALGQVQPADGTTIFPVTPLEFQMITDYNGQKVNYDVTFTRTVVSPGVIHYTNWSVQFLPDDLAKWTPAGISNIQAPAFTIPPPATNADPKKFELNYISGGAHGRYIDDTYTKVP
ncbi:MAG: DUF1735 domain-containing protein [Sphingobacteriales bacterium]